MAINEEERIAVSAEKANNRQNFLSDLLKSENFELIQPFGAFRWPLFGPLVVFSLIALVFFER